MSRPATSLPAGGPPEVGALCWVRTKVCRAPPGVARGLGAHAWGAVPALQGPPPVRPRQVRPVPQSVAYRWCLAGIASLPTGQSRPPRPSPARGFVGHPRVTFSCWQMSPRFGGTGASVRQACSATGGPSTVDFATRADVGSAASTAVCFERKESSWKSRGIGANGGRTTSAAPPTTSPRRSPPRRPG